MTNTDIIKGKMRQTEGKIETKFGDVVDSPKHEVKGMMKQAEGKIQEGVGKAREAAKKSTEHVKKS